MLVLRGLQLLSRFSMDRHIIRQIKAEYYGYLIILIIFTSYFKQKLKNDVFLNLGKSFITFSPRECLNFFLFSWSHFDEIKRK